MRKTLLFLALSIFLVSFVSAVSISGSWQNGAQSATISFRNSASFNADFYTISPPMTLNIKMYNSTGALVYVFEKNTVSTDYSFADTYTVNENAYKNPGNYTIVLSATDSFPSSKSTNLTLDVLQGGNNPPVITSSPITSVNENTEYNYQVTATDKDGDTLTYSLINGPSWLSINSQTGLIAGMAPNVSVDKSYGISVQVSDGKADVSQNYTLTVKNVPVNHAPIITSKPVTAVNENTQYKYQVVATDTDNNTLTYSLNSNASSWLSINSQTGLITGMAPNVLSDKNYYVGITVNDGHGGTATQTYTLTVKNVNHLPVISPIPDQSINENSFYQYQVVASDPDGDRLTYTITGPSWLSINSGTGLVSGVSPSVTQDTNYSVGISVSDGIATVSRYYILTVKNINHAPKIMSVPIKTVNESTLYKYQVVATDQDNDKLTYSMSSNASWLNIDSSTGLISGTAPGVTKNMNYYVIVSVSDGQGGIATQNYILTVLNVIVPPVNHAPVAQNEHLTTNESTPIKITLSATDQDNDLLTYMIKSNPFHGTVAGFDSSTGTLIYTPNSNFVGQDSFTFAANDGQADSNVATVYINVTKKICPPKNHTPVITSIPLKTVNENTQYNYQVVATDADNNTLTYSLNTNASWLSINPSTGSVSGMAPSVNGDTAYSVNIEVNDGQGGIATQSYTLIVKNTTIPDTTPPVVTISSPTNNTYSTSNVSLIVSTNENATAWFSINRGENKTISASYGLNFNYALNSLSNGHYNLVVYAEDVEGNVGNANVSFSINVQHHNSGGGSSSVGEGVNNQVPPIVVGADYGNISQTITAPIEAQGPTPQQSKTSPTWPWILGILILFILILMVLILIRRSR